MASSGGSGKQLSLEQRVLRFILKKGLIPREQKLVVAVSGGADSVCLLHVLVGLQKELGISLHVAHLDHRLRGEAARADARYVAGLAARLGVPAILEQQDVAAYQAQQRLSLEEAAREVRYDFLARAARSVGTGWVVMGHTLDDHIETVLMHLIRGSGTRGLRGLQPLSVRQASGLGLTIIRPLLDVSREETAAYCRSRRLRPRLDASNLSEVPLRNRVRRQLLPLLHDYNPQITEALLRTARIATADLEFLDRAAEGLWGEVAEEREGTIVLNKERFTALPVAMQRHLLRDGMEKLQGNLTDVEERHIEQIMGALHKPAGRRLSLPGGLVFAVEYDKYLLGADAAALCPLPVLGGVSSLKVPGETLLPGWRVTAAIGSPGEVTQESRGFSARFDLEKTGTELAVRRYRAGDRFRPLGVKGSKKLGEFMIDAKIPRAWRGRVPVVCSPGQVLWLVGWRIDERVKVTADTSKVLYLSFAPR